MAELTLNLSSAVFAKTGLGQQEIQTRSLGLSLLVRRVLVLIDGQRNGKELAVFVPGQDAFSLIDELLTRNCIEIVAAPEPAVVAAPPVPVLEPALPAKIKVKKTDAPELSKLPAPETRGPKEVEMARNFMTNSINNMFGQHTRLSLIESIFACSNSNDLRQIYPAWVETLSASAIGARRLPELRQKLFAVL